MTNLDSISSEVPDSRVIETVLHVFRFGRLILGFLRLFEPISSFQLDLEFRIEMESAAWEEVEEEWELCNDGDFVYKRKKRRQDLSAAAAAAAAAAATPTSDPEAEHRQLRERRKRVLLKLKDQYQSEIDQWQRMSNKLQAMDNRAQPQSSPSPSSSSSMESVKPPFPELDSTCRQLIDDLVSKAEAQEAILQDLSNLCETVETLCNAQEEHLKQPFIDLPVWATPGALMTSLSDD